MTELLDARATAARLPYFRRVDELVRVLHDPVARVPPRLVQALPGGSSLS
jgi:1-piperideine-2-carboxylate/1-pyrroline-2-carboxylate reductase [NAD(P)H]